jgi:hypothetical protein
MGFRVDNWWIDGWMGFRVDMWIGGWMVGAMCGLLDVWIVDEAMVV